MYVRLYHSSIEVEFICDCKRDLAMKYTAYILVEFLVGQHETYIFSTGIEGGNTKLVIYDDNRIMWWYCSIGIFKLFFIFYKTYYFILTSLSAPRYSYFLVGNSQLENAVEIFNFVFTNCILKMGNSFKNIHWQHWELNIKGEKLNHFRFAGEIMLVTDSLGETQTMLQELEQTSKKEGLIGHTSKSMNMTNLVVSSNLTL